MIPLNTIHAWVRTASYLKLIHGRWWTWYIKLFTVTSSISKITNPIWTLVILTHSCTPLMLILMQIASHYRTWLTQVMTKGQCSVPMGLRGCLVRSILNLNRTARKILVTRCCHQFLYISSSLLPRSEETPRLKPPCAKRATSTPNMALGIYRQSEKVRM